MVCTVARNVLKGQQDPAGSRLGGRRRGLGYLKGKIPLTGKIILHYVLTPKGDVSAKGSVSDPLGSPLSVNTSASYTERQKS